MTRAQRIFAGLLAVTAILAACRDYMPSNSFLRPRPAPAANQSTAEARHKFEP